MNVKNMIPTVAELRSVFSEVYVSADICDDTKTLNEAHGVPVPLIPYNLWDVSYNVTQKNKNSRIPRFCMDYDIFKLFLKSGLDTFYYLLNNKFRADKQFDRYLKKHTGK